MLKKLIAIIALCASIGLSDIPNYAAFYKGTNPIQSIYQGQGLIWQLAQVWTPATIANCHLWIDFNDASSLTLDGSTVLIASDKSGAGHNAISSSYPSTGVGTYNTESEQTKFVYFSGETTTPIFNTTVTVACPHTLFIVAKCTSAGYDSETYRAMAGDGNYPLVAGNGMAYLRTGWGAPFLSANYLFYSEGAGSWDGSGYATYDTNEKFVYTFQFQASPYNISAWKNGGLDAEIQSYATGTETREGFIIGGSYVDFQRWLGNIYEVIYYARALDASEMATVESYIAAKHGITVSSR